VVFGPAFYTTDYGSAYLGDSLDLLDELEGESVDLVVTSPPFALQREKKYGNVNQGIYVDKIALSHIAQRNFWIIA
jgi:DNA modification methylase